MNETIPLDMNKFTDLSIFRLSDLMGRTVSISSFKGERGGLVFATDTKSGEVFILKEETE